MQDFKGCVSKTRRLLKQFHSLQATLANLQDDLAALEQMAGLEQAAPISKYSDLPGGGQTIDVIDDMLDDAEVEGYYKGNIIKYIARWPLCTMYAGSVRKDSSHYIKR